MFEHRKHNGIAKDSGEGGEIIQERAEFQLWRVRKLWSGGQRRSHSTVCVFNATELHLSWQFPVLAVEAGGPVLESPALIWKDGRRVACSCKLSAGEAETEGDLELIGQAVSLNQQSAGLVKDCLKE